MAAEPDSPAGVEVGAMNRFIHEEVLEQSRTILRRSAECVAITRSEVIDGRGVLASTMERIIRTQECISRTDEILRSIRHRVGVGGPADRRA